MELGRTDICCEVSMLSLHLALPRRGHLENKFHMFAFLKCHANSKMVFDPGDVDFDIALFPRKDWDYSIYTQDDTKLVEELPPNMPKPRGKGMTTRVYVNSDHAGDTVTRISSTGFIIFLNASPIYWIPKKQTSCKTSSFGSEFCAMKQATYYLEGCATS